MAEEKSAPAPPLDIGGAGYSRKESIPGDAHSLAPMSPGGALETAALRWLGKSLGRGGLS
jgi:hypothetical protein